MKNEPVRLGIIGTGAAVKLLHLSGFHSWSEENASFAIQAKGKLKA
jgi:hypothetical protein